jgi:hypothetical protein
MLTDESDVQGLEDGVGIQEVASSQEKATRARAPSSKQTVQLRPERLWLVQAAWCREADATNDVPHEDNIVSKLLSVTMAKIHGSIECLIEAN